MKTVIGHLDFYIPSKKAEGEAISKVKELIENTTEITDVKYRDIAYGEMRFSGMLNGEELRFKWDYFNGEISYGGKEYNIYI